jgi:serine/threonine protein kinase
VGYRGDDESTHRQGGVMIGQKLSHYQFTERISEGGMGTVYKAEDFALKRTVAIKMIKPSHQDPQIASKRFLREAQAISQIDHPNVVTVHEIIQKGDANFLIMQYIHGESLRERLRRQRMDPSSAFRVASDVAAGLDAAHQIGVVHRDIKPENIMIDQSGRSKVLDFGVARLVDRSTLTRKGRIVGTLPYMAPENIKGNPVDARSDVYSLGVVLYEMLSGQVPLDDKEEAAFFFKIINVDPEPVSTRVPGLSLDVDPILVKALAKDPARRYQTAAEMRLDLEATYKKLDAEKPTTVPPHPGRSRKRLIIGWVAAAILLAALVILWRAIGPG